MILKTIAGQPKEDDDLSVTTAGIILNSIVFLFFITSLCIAQVIQPGSYVAEGGWGDLTIKRGKDGNTVFKIFAMGGNAHTCDLGGEIKNGRAVLTEAAEDGKPCIIRFVIKGASIEVTQQTPDICRYFCGARASFEGTYQRPPVGCSSREMIKTRSEFKKLYDKKQYAEALARLEPVLSDCSKILHWLDKGRIQNDLAVTLHKLGRYDDCIKTLEPLAADAAKTDEQIREDYPPSDADNYLPIVRSTRTNLKLCRAGKGIR